MTIYKATISSKTNNTNSTNESSVGKLPRGQDVSNSVPSSNQSNTVNKVVQKTLSNASELQKSGASEKNHVDFTNEKNRLVGKDMYGEQIVKKAITFMEKKGWMSTDALKNKYLPSNHFSKFEKACQKIKSMDTAYAQLTDTYSEKIVKDALSTQGIFSATELYDKSEEIIVHLRGICEASTSTEKSVPTRQIENDVKNSKPIHKERKAPIGAKDTVFSDQKTKK